jgi:hypothetical protein
MAVLNAKQRAASATIKRPGKPASDQGYPIPDKNHARAALMLINKGGLSPAQKAKVRTKADSVLGKR